MYAAFLTMGTNDLIGGMFKMYVPPFLIFCIAVVIFSYFVSKGKRIVGVAVGIVLTLIAFGLFASNFLD